MMCVICGSDTDKSTAYSALIGNACEYCLKQIRKRLCGLTWPVPQITGPRRWDDEARGTVIAVFDSKIIGLRCAKIKYGVDAVSEMARGYKYQDEHGDTIVRITDKDVPETERCHKCGLSLWACNAMEVMI